LLTEAFVLDFRGLDSAEEHGNSIGVRPPGGQGKAGEQQQVLCAHFFSFGWTTAVAKRFPQLTGSRVSEQFISSALTCLRMAAL
jgi:hypothetical protein